MCQKFSNYYKINLYQEYPIAKSGIKLFYLPAYSPDYNPDEYLNQDYKQSANKYELPTTQKELRNNTEKYMLSIQNNPQKVANFIKHPKVQYAG
ncbi:transposase [Aliarcobacter cibarius]|uniref:transposase n=1 Tax=Aliarcobacter cibarius TaxID=255507 RepID=UPI0018691774|nr:transposase [Aliarcobacter cibarius]